MSRFQKRIQKELTKIESDGLYKKERIITTPQGVEISTQEAGGVLNF